MSQASQIIADGPGAAVLAAINAANAALASNSSGTAFPDYLVAGQFVWRTNVPGSGVWTLYAWTGTAGAAILTMDTATGAIAFNSAVYDAAFGSTQGMILKRGLSTWAGLALGQAWQGLRVNAAGADLEYGDQWQKLAADAAPASAASVSFTGIPAAINDIEIRIRDLLPAVNGNNLYMQVYDSGGAAITTAVYYGGYGYSAFNGTSQGGGNALGAFPLHSNGTLSSAAAIVGVVRLYDIQSGNKKSGGAVLQWVSGYPFTSHNGLYVDTSSTITGIKLYFGSGNIARGKVALWGSR